jgi:hypothetical protein
MPPSKYDAAGRQIAGLLGYNPGPGIYSRLERAIQEMPETVRTQELPGLLKRYKDGVPGWELKATNLDEVIAGRAAVPRDELLARVREASPVYTHKEVVLSDDGPVIKGNPYDVTAVPWDAPAYQDAASRIGQGVRHGDPKYKNYGQGGEQYTEILLTQPGAREGDYGNHWSGAATQSTDAAEDAVAHARFDVHDGFLRVNELQSDLGIHNRKVREWHRERAGRQLTTAEDAVRYLEEPLEYPLEDSSLELLLKRLNLYAAQHGLRGVEIASPRAIAEKVGGNIENYEHYYGKVVAGQQDRLGRRMGGQVQQAVAPDLDAETPLDVAFKRVQAEKHALRDAAHRVRGMPPSDGPSVGGRGWRAYAELEHAANPAAYDATLNTFGGRVISPAAGDYGAPDIADAANKMYVALIRHEGFTPEQAGRLVGEAVYRAQGAAGVRESYNRAFMGSRESARRNPDLEPTYRAVMSDEMRRRIIEQGIGASVLAPLLMQDEEQE